MCFDQKTKPLKQFLFKHSSLINLQRAAQQLKQQPFQRKGLIRLLFALCPWTKRRMQTKGNKLKNCSRSDVQVSCMHFKGGQRTAARSREAD